MFLLVMYSCIRQKIILSIKYLICCFVPYRFDGLEVDIDFNDVSASDRHNWTLHNYISLFWDDNFLKEMCKYTDMRFHQETGNVLNLSLNDMKAYLGATLLMSCLGYP